MMRIFVKFDALDSIHGPEDVVVRKAIGEQLKKIIASGKMESGGSFGDVRGGYMILNVNSGAELQELIGLPYLINFQIESHPLITFEEVLGYIECQIHVMEHNRMVVRKPSANTVNCLPLGAMWQMIRQYKPVHCDILDESAVRAFTTKLGEQISTWAFQCVRVR